MSENFGQNLANILAREMATIRYQQRRSWPPTTPQQQQLSAAAGHQNGGIVLANGAREEALKDMAETIEAIAKAEFNRRFDQYLADKRKSDTQRNIEQRANRRQQAYKTVLCTRFVNTGQCHYGEQCQFAHAVDELRVRQIHPKYKTRLCRNFSRHGCCYYGQHCQFMHRTPPNSPQENPRPLALSAITFNNGVGGMNGGPYFIPQLQQSMPMPITSNPQYGAPFVGHHHGHHQYAAAPPMLYSPPAYVDQNGFGIPNALVAASTSAGHTHQFQFPSAVLRR